MRRPRAALRRRADRGYAPRSMLERTASLSASLSLVALELSSINGLGWFCIRRRACHLDLAIHCHMHILVELIGGAVVGTLGGTRPDLKRTCASCFLVVQLALCYVSSVVWCQVVVISRSGQHSPPRALFCTVLGATCSRGIEWTSRVRDG